MTCVLWYNLVFTYLVQLEAININFKNLIVVYQITLWRLTLLMHLRIVLINTGLTKMLFMTTNQI